MNWIYIGSTQQWWLKVKGKVVHPRSLGSHFGRGESHQSVAWLRENVDPDACRVDAGWRHRYAMPLCRAMRRQVEAMRQPYPKRAVADETGSADQAEEAGQNRPDRSND